MLTAQEIRAKFFSFFQSKGHALMKSASLIPENDPTVLFTTAGMHPLVPYLMGEKHPAGNRLVDVQKCVRTDDIDEVGDNRHLVFFEMLGNWSLGDYFKQEAIEWSFEFLTSKEWLGLDINRLAVSVFAGDADAPFDEEAFNKWKELGISEARIAKLPKENNWWPSSVMNGPCGADTEIFYWVGDPDKVPESFNDDNDLWVEIWNNVFMQYNKKADGAFELLEKKNVDTGMGLERILTAVNGAKTVFDTDLFQPLIKKIEELSGKKYGENESDDKAFRVIADHLRAATFIIGDELGVPPSNTGAGYIVRRLIRRAVIYGRRLSISQSPWLLDVAVEVIKNYSEAYPELLANQDFILKNISEEELKFEKTLENGLKEFSQQCESLTCKMEDDDNITITIPGAIVFQLFSTYGFPVELIREIANEKKMLVDEEGFAEEFKKHQELSRTASAGMFKGGLADAGEETKKLHTAAHLLLASLRKVLGDHIFQKGSNITAERLRFDFSHPEKMTPEQIAEVENLVNEAIAKNFPIICQEKSLAEAKTEGAMGVFESKYGEMVKTYTIGTSSTSSESPFSREICGGPHATTTGELGHFKIVKEESSSSGVRRIKAILE
jgi:alanyl-tRNA synthetase